MLAIGIVVDDAIVVLENIERWLDKGLPVREATIKAMDEITGPIMAITLVLSSVLIPSAFLGGITGQFFRQFALTIAVSMLISAVNAMTMTPARAAWIFAKRKPGGAPGTPGHGDQGKEALPWWSFALLGGLATVWMLKPVFGARLGLPVAAENGEAVPGGIKETLLACWAYLVLFLPGAVAGGAIGRVVIRSAQLGTGSILLGLQLGLQAGDANLRKGGGLVPAPEHDHAGSLCRPDCAHRLQLHPRPHGVHPHTGQGPAGRQRSIARFGLPGAYDGSHGQDRDDLPRDARRRPHDLQSGPVLHSQRGQLESRLGVRSAQAVP